MKTEMKCLCLHAMTVVYSQYYEQIGPFSDTKFIVNMLEKVGVNKIYNWSVFEFIFMKLDLGLLYTLVQLQYGSLFE